MGYRAKKIAFRLVALADLPPASANRALIITEQGRITWHTATTYF